MEDGVTPNEQTSELTLSKNSCDLNSGGYIFRALQFALRDEEDRQTDRQAKETIGRLLNSIYSARNEDTADGRTTAPSRFLYKG